MNQCMGCQAGWPLRHATHEVVGGYRNELVACTKDHYEVAAFVVQLTADLATARAALIEMTAARDAACAEAEEWITCAEMPPVGERVGGTWTEDRARITALRAVGAK